ncbi:MAG: hypothetical protein ACI8ZM_003381 [Crocinitomix sp.]|jgi:hypothetical protein
MKRKLKLAFAMGGGVSLGTFSGAALSKSIILSLLYAEYEITNENGEKEKRRYDEIVIDVFSGASAGSMALGIMLRTLVQRTDEQEAVAKLFVDKTYKKRLGELKAELGDAEKYKELYDNLIAAQVVYDVQYKIWVEEVNIKRLLGGSTDKGAAKELKYAAGLFDSEALYEIANDYFDFDGEELGLEKKRILSDRVVFASTLSNLTGIHNKAKDLYTVNPAGAVGLEDGMISTYHREIRVKDLHFSEIDPNDDRRYPKRWLRFHNGDKVVGKTYDLRSKKAWSRIATTSLACGAFPFAFAPVVLNRKKFEYAENEWPIELKSAKEYNFTYTDGGEFRNEPIREAFRLAAFMDALDDSDFDRKVIFVDPSVSPKVTHFNLPIHSEYLLEEPDAIIFNKVPIPFDGKDLVKKTTLERLLAHTPKMLEGLFDHASINELDRVYQVRNMFDIRDFMRSVWSEALKEKTVSSEDVKITLEFCKMRVAEYWNNEIIPAGAMSLADEIARVFNEEKGPGGSFGDVAEMDVRVEKARELTLKTSREKRLVALESYLNSLEEAEQKIWYKALLFLSVDLSLNLMGKHKNYELIAITPTRNPGTKDQHSVALPGGGMAAFTGFLSWYMSDYETRFADFCTLEFLKVSKLIDKDIAGQDPGGFEEDYLKDQLGNNLKAFNDELKEGLELLNKRVTDLLSSSELLNSTGMPLIRQLALWQLKKKIKKAVSKANEESEKSKKYEFRINVPSSKYRMDGKGWVSDVKAKNISKLDYDFRELKEKLTGHYEIITILEYSESKGWTGVHVKKQKIEGVKTPVIHIQRGNKNFCSIRLPKKAILKKLLLQPNPILAYYVDDSDYDKKGMPAKDFLIRTGVIPLAEKLFKYKSDQASDKKSGNYRFRINVPSLKHELWGGNELKDKDDFPAVYDKGNDGTTKQFYITLEVFLDAKNKWDKDFIQENQFDIRIEKNISRKDIPFCKIQMPSEEDLLLYKRTPRAMLEIDIISTDKDKDVKGKRWTVLRED